MQKKIISFNEYQTYIAKICHDIVNSSWRPDYVVGITRGGCLPAVMISHYFNCPCETLKVSLRDSNSECESNLWMAEDAFKESKNILIVDDINDTGQTLNWIVNDWEESCTGIITSDRQQNTWNHNVKFACIVDNLSSNFAYNVDYTGFEINKAEIPVWIEFPYEQWWLQ